MPTNSGRVLLLLKIALCVALYKSRKTSKLISVGIPLFNILLILKLPFLSIPSMLCGDLKTNQGPKAISQQGVSVCPWNLSIFAHNLAKIFLFKAYAATHKFDITCLSETYLGLSIPTSNGNLDIDGSNLARSDHPSNIKRGGVCINFMYLFICFKFI